MNISTAKLDKKYLKLLKHNSKINLEIPTVYILLLNAIVNHYAEILDKKLKGKDVSQDMDDFLHGPYHILCFRVLPNILCDLGEGIQDTLMSSKDTVKFLNKNEDMVMDYLDYIVNKVNEPTSNEETVLKDEYNAYYE